jgi:hypothetical protein
MHILDESNLLNDAEKEQYYSLLKTYGFEPHDFRVRVTEDQKPMDMNDLNYVIVVKVKATHLKSNVTKIYESSAESGIWLAEMEEDLKAGEFKNH